MEQIGEENAKNVLSKLQGIQISKYNENQL